MGSVTTTEGLNVPAGSDPFDPAGDMVDLANSFRSRLVYPVPNATARDALRSAITWTPTADAPLLVHRGDSGTLERNVGGTGATAWTKVAGNPKRAAAGQNDFAITAISSTTTAVTLATLSVVADTAGFLRVDLDLTLRSDGQAQAWVDVFLGSTRLDSRWVETNTTVLGDAGIHGEYDLPAGTSSFTVRAIRATGTNLRFNSGKVRLSW